MQRRKFITMTLVLSALGASAKTNKMSSNEVPPKGFAVKAGESRTGEHIKLGGVSPNDVKVSANDTNGNLAVFEYMGNEKGGPPLHVHLNQDEIFYIVEGEYLFQVGEEKHRLKTGDTIFLPRNIPHAFAQLRDKGKMFFFFNPAGKMEDYFRTIGKWHGQPSQAEAVKAFEDHDMKIVGPPLKVE